MYVCKFFYARLAQSVERKTLNLVVVGSIPTEGAFLLATGRPCGLMAKARPS